MEKYSVKGMRCSACVARVEKAVKAVSGVSDVCVNLLSNSMTVEGTAQPKEIIKAVENAGFKAKLYSENEDKKENSIALRLTASAVLLALLMIFKNGYFQLTISLIILILNKSFFVSGLKGVLHLAPNMDTLVSLGSGISFIWSVYVLFFYKGHLYFESSAMILVLITVGKLLEAKSKGRTTNSISSIVKLSPKFARVLKDSEQEIPVKDVKIGDIFLVKPGESFPVDGVVLEGTSTADESTLSGESMPIEKTIGSEVFSATINGSGFLKCRATKLADSSVFSQIIKTVTRATETKAPIQRLADKVAGVFVPFVMFVSIITLIVWIIIGKSFEFSLEKAISVLVISCPCSLGLATPVAIMVSSGVGAKCGILFKTAESLEILGKVKTVALDKTGTITEGKPKVCDILPKNISKSELVKIAYSMEKQSEHPISKAICEIGEDFYEVKSFKANSGLGVEAELNGEKYFAGSIKFIEKMCEIPKLESYLNDGKTPVLFCKEGTFLGAIFVADKEKTDSKEAINAIQDMGIETVMLTGDNKLAAKFIAKIVGTDKVFAEIMPDEKLEIIEKLKKTSRVAMVGDGINDAPSITCADVGIALGAGTDIAIESCDVVIMNNSLNGLARAIKLSKDTLKTIKQNLFWAFFYNALGIPIAAGVFYKFGISLSPMICAGAMSISSIFVVLNALRLNRKGDKK